MKNSDKLRVFRLKAATCNSTVMVELLLHEAMKTSVNLCLKNVYCVCGFCQNLGLRLDAVSRCKHLIKMSDK